MWRCGTGIAGVVNGPGRSVISRAQSQAQIVMHLAGLLTLFMTTVSIPHYARYHEDMLYNVVITPHGHAHSRGQRKEVFSSILHEYLSPEKLFQLD